MKVVVTGGSGRIGSMTAQALRDAGHEVLTLDQLPPVDLTSTHRIIDLRDASAVRLAIQGYEAICHIGEMPNIRNNQQQVCFATNTQIGSAVMQSAADVGMTKIIYTSTCQVYGCWGSENGPLTPPRFLPMDETHPVQPSNMYALSKVANEMYARILSDRTGISVAAYRLPATHTPDFLKAYASRIGHTIDRPLRKDGFGTHLFVEDAANAYLRGIESTWAGFEAFHFVADEVLTSVPVREALLEYYPQTPLPENWGDFASPVVSDKAKRMLGWRAQFNLRQAFLSAA